MVITIVSAVLLGLACRRHEPPMKSPVPDGAVNQSAADNLNASVGGNDNASPPQRPYRVRIDGPDPLDQERWLFVEEIREGAKGAWAEGDFLPDRNKIAITTHDVTQFAIDFSRIPVNWDRLVVLGIDGFNGSMARREHPLVHFQVTPTGDWVVIEKDPPTRQP